jgi:exodeoxyribonuclease VII large subunit
LILYPAQVQGEGAEKTIIDGIQYFNSRSDIDVIIVGRGGGSLEDLWCFNEESLVRTIVDSEIPIVSGVGHEIDTTLSDLAADLRAATPSAAAELVIWDKRNFLYYIGEIYRRIDQSIRDLINVRRKDIVQLITRPVFKRPESFIREKQQYLDSVIRLFEIAAKNILEMKKNSLSLHLSRLESLSPRAVLKRGYAVVKMLPSGAVVKSVEDLKKDDLIETVLADGQATAKVRDIKREKKNAAKENEN